MSTFSSRPLRILAAAVLLGSLVAAAPTASAGEGDVTTVEVIVQKFSWAGGVPERAVTDLGGEVGVHLSIIDGFTATVPVGAVAALEQVDGVRFVTIDVPVHLMSDLSSNVEDGSDALGAEARASGRQSFPAPLDVAEVITAEPTRESEIDPDIPRVASEKSHFDETAHPDKSVYAEAVGADVAHGAGATGSGVTVALIDTGVADLADLRNVIVPVRNVLGQTRRCVNLSGEFGCGDSYGHGTFIAGLIAGNGAASGGKYVGMAPDAKVLSVKIAGRDGSASVGKILFAIQWVVDHRDEYGVKVMNLSLGTDSPQSYLHDPLNYAVERAWDSGITVVVSAGNRGPTNGTISKPADDPLVITAGAVDDVQTASIDDDTLPDFSSRGPTKADGLIKPDITAPGGRLISLRSPNSAIEQNFPGGGIDSVYRRGSGTSQSAGVISGSVALLLSKHPEMSPDQIKYALMQSARAVASSDPNAVGAGMLDIGEAVVNPPRGEANQGLPRAFGDGSLQLSQGSVKVVAKADELVLGVLGNVVPIRGYDSADPSGGSWYGTSWYGGSWYGGSWYGGSWYGGSWYGGSWYGGSWYGGSWYGAWD